MSWLTDPIQIAPWIIYLVVAGSAAAGFVAAAAFIVGKPSKPGNVDPDRWSDYP